MLKQGFLFGGRLRDPAEADLPPIRRGQDDVGNLDSLPDPKRYRELRAQLADDMMNGFFDDYGGVILPTSDAPREPLFGTNFRAAFHPAVPGGIEPHPHFLKSYVARDLENPEDRTASRDSWDPVLHERRRRRVVAEEAD